jgi:hypothetical protein
MFAYSNHREKENLVRLEFECLQDVEHHTSRASKDAHVMLTGQTQFSILSLSRQLEHGKSLLSNPVCL